MKHILYILSAISLISCSSPQKKENTNPELNPKLTRPEVSKVWVPDRIVGDEYEAGHWKYIINRNSSWAKED